MYLITSLKEHYDIDIDWVGSRYTRITLKWDYKNKHVDASVPNYTKTKLTEFSFTSTKKRNLPHPAPPTSNNS